MSGKQTTGRDMDCAPNAAIIEAAGALQAAGIEVDAIVDPVKVTAFLNMVGATELLPVIKRIILMFSGANGPALVVLLGEDQACHVMRPPAQALRAVQTAILGTRV